MKTVLRILNLVIVALCGVSIYFMNFSPTLSLYANAGLEVSSFQKLLPESDYTKDIDLKSMLGTEELHIPVSFSFGIADVFAIMGGNETLFNTKVVINNIDEIYNTVEEPVDLITRFSVRSVIKSVLKKEITTQVQAAADQYGAGSTASDIMDEVGMNDNYFSDFAITLYDAINEDGATVSSTSQVLLNQIEDVLAKAETTGAVDISSYSEDAKNNIRANYSNARASVGLIKEDGNHLYKVSEMVMTYFSEFLKSNLKGTVEDSELERQEGEALSAYVKRLLAKTVFRMIPEVAYQGIKLGATITAITFIVLLVIFGFLALFTLIKTFSPNKPWTFFGPFFYIGGLVLITLGLGITVFGKYIFPMLNLLPNPTVPFLHSLGLGVRTFALVPSLIFVGFFVFAMVYDGIKGSAKRNSVDPKFKFKEGGRK